MTNWHLSSLLTIIFIASFHQNFVYADGDSLRNFFSQVVKSNEDEVVLNLLEERLPKFVELNLPSNDNVEKIFDKFKIAARLIPNNIQSNSTLNSNSAREIFHAIQPIHRYVKDSVWKSILTLIDLPQEFLRIPAQNLADEQLNRLLNLSDDETVSKLLRINSNRLDFSEDQKSILVRHYVERFKSKLNSSNFQELITQSLGASFLRYLPNDFLLNDPILNENSVIRNVATWLSLLTPSQRDAISSKVYRLLSDTTGRIGSSLGPLGMTVNDPSTLDIIARLMPSLSTRQSINTIADRITVLLDRSSLRDDQSCTSALALLNRTLEAKRTVARHLRPNPQLIYRWQQCYSGCDLRELLNDRNDLKELLKNHPNPEHCDDLIHEVKKEFNIERQLTSNKLREVSDAFGLMYRSTEIKQFTDELMAEFGRDEKLLEKLGSQELTVNQARTILTKIPRSTQNLWGKNTLGKLGHLLPAVDNTILKQILTRGRGDLPILFNHTSASIIRQLVPSKIRLLIDQYANEPNLAKYRPLLASDYAKRFIKSETLTKLLQLTPDVLRLIRFSPAQASVGIAKQLGSETNFDGSLPSLVLINNFVNGLTKTDVDKIQVEKSLQAIQQVFGSSKNKNIDNEMFSNTLFAFGDLLRRGLQNTEATKKPEEYIKGLFREDNLVEDLNPQLFTTLNNDELESINRLTMDEGRRFWNAIGSIREPTCCSISDENRFRLADFALKFYGSATGDIDNFKLSQLGPFLSTSLRPNDIRRITTDALINKIDFFKTACFQPNRAQAQALGAQLNRALAEVDDGMKILYLDLIGELSIFLPTEINAGRTILSQRTNFLSKSMEKFNEREGRCQILDRDQFLTEAKANIRRTLVKVLLDEHHQSVESLNCQQLRSLGPSISSLSIEEISSITAETIFKCITVFGVVEDFRFDQLRTIAEKYLKALQSSARHINSLSQSELYELNSILKGFTPDQLFQLEEKHFHDGNFLSFIGNLDGWSTEQLRRLAKLAIGNDEILSPSFLENAGKILCVVEEKFLNRISSEDVKSYLTIFANIRCPTDDDIHFASTMLKMVVKIYQNDIYRPSVFGSLGSIGAGFTSDDFTSIPADLLNFFPSEALARLPSNVLKTLSNEQLKNLNIEQVEKLRKTSLESLTKRQMRIIQEILNPFQNSEKLLTVTEKSNSDQKRIDSAAALRSVHSTIFTFFLPISTIVFAFHH